MTLLRQAMAGDAANLEDFLAQYPDTSMFLRGNLASHGLDNTEHRHGTTFWMSGTDVITGVVACTNGGYLMCQAPSADGALWRAAADILEGRQIAGITGVPEQVNAWADALGLERVNFAVKETEPLYRLALNQLKVPKITGMLLRSPCSADISMLSSWFDGFARVTGISPTDGPTGLTAAEVFAAHSDARVLERDGALVAMTSLNARTTETVQIGGVYVPDALRGQGLGGYAVAAQLSELRAEGIAVAILFAANAPAAKAYEKIGFEHIGSYEVAVLKTPITIKGTCNVL